MRCYTYTGETRFLFFSLIDIVMTMLHCEPHVCTLILLRHGATDCNLQHPPILQGRSIDLPLSAAGQIQATQASDFLAKVPLSAVYSSHLLRAKETAEAIAQPHNLEVHVEQDLVEVNVGRWESRSWVEIKETEPEAYFAFQNDPGVHGYAGGENLQQVQERVRPVFERLAQRHLGQVIAIAGHNVVNRAFLAHVLCLPLSKARTLPQDNGCINVIRYQAGEHILRTMNSTFHLR
jgi:broad specificity phosphatase PhoE